MRGFFNYDGTLNRLMTKIMYFVSLNLLFLVTSIPIVTIGASATALYTVMFRYLEGNEPHILKTYFKAFRDNFKKSEIVWGMIMLMIVLLTVDFAGLSHMQGSIAKIMVVVPVMVLIPLLMSCIYIFGIIAYFDNTLKGYLLYSISLAVARLPETLCLLIINLFPMVLFYIAVTSGSFMVPLFLCCGVSLPAYLETRILKKQFVRTINMENI